MTPAASNKHRKSSVSKITCSEDGWIRGNGESPIDWGFIYPWPRLLGFRNISSGIQPDYEINRHDIQYFPSTHGSLTLIQDAGEAALNPFRTLLPEASDLQRPPSCVFPPLHTRNHVVAVFEPIYTMKRNYGGIPVDMTHNWGKPPLSCLPCRQKKRRCDRNQPCWNCAQRGISCEYPDQNDGHHERTVPVQLSDVTNHAAVDSASLEGSSAKLTCLSGKALQR